MGEVVARVAAVMMSEARQDLGQWKARVAARRQETNIRQQRSVNKPDIGYA